jgi:hypothetical protein
MTKSVNKFFKEIMEDIESGFSKITVTNDDVIEQAKIGWAC